MPFATISVIGLGYIGLPTAAVFASRKKQVIGVDVNQNAVDIINRGQIHIVEPDLDIAHRELVKALGTNARIDVQPAEDLVISSCLRGERRVDNISQPPLQVAGQSWH